MSKQKMTILAVSAALILVLAIFWSFYLSSIRGLDDPIDLPPEQTASPDQDGFPDDTEPLPTPSPVIKIDVTVENVQTVLATLARPDAYSMTVKTETFYKGGSGTEQNAIWVRQGVSKIESLTDTGFPAEHAIIGLDKTYIWLQGTALPYEGNPGEFSADTKLRIPTYEKILAADIASIDLADYVLLDDIPCVYVKLSPDRLSYIEEFWVNINTGLLYLSEKRKDGQLIIRTTTESYSNEIPTREKFRLPNGQLILPED